MDLRSPLRREASAEETVSFRYGRPLAWYDRGMTKARKIAISLPPEQVEQAREAVARGEAASVSGYISAALTAVAPVSSGGVEEDTLAAFAAELIAEDGEPSAEAYAWADRVLAMSEPD
jgi:Arc/MetJ-type ribon-helix-helix transcriptional regulator